MKFETINKSNKKYIIIGIILFCILGSVMVLKTTRAKYRTTQSINIVNGTVNYSAADFRILAMYQENDSGTYTEINTMPSIGYKINESKSYCTIDGTNKDNNAVLKTIGNNHTFANLSKNSKCYLYFDKATAKEMILANVFLKETTPDYTQVATIDEGVYKISDGMYGGYSYVWRGAVTNNWVKFGGFYWRIIRINGDGTVRMIYQGKESDGPKATGTGTVISNDGGTTRSYKYNSSSNRSEYVGYTYSEGSQRTLEGTPSTVKGVVDTWYNNNLASYADKIENGKFCNDRNMASGYTWSSTGKDVYYAGYDRLVKGKSPTLSCPASDIYTLKAGLITADEVSMAGGVWDTSNYSYYLDTGGIEYMTMTPLEGYDRARVFRKFASTDSNYSYSVASSMGVRPVINLKADTTFSEGNGTSSNPYVVL